MANKYSNPEAELTMDYFRRSLTPRYNQWMEGALTDRVFYYEADRLSTEQKNTLRNKSLPAISRDKIKDLVDDTLAFTVKQLPDYNVAAIGKEDLFISSLGKHMLDRVINISNGEYLVRQAVLDSMVIRRGIILPYYDKNFTDGEYHGEVRWKRIDGLSVIVDENCTDPWWEDAQFVILPYEVTEEWIEKNYGKDIVDYIKHAAVGGSYKDLANICQDMKINRESGVLGKIYNKTNTKIDRYFLMERYSRDGAFWEKVRSVGSVLLEKPQKIKIRHCPPVPFVWTWTGNPFSQGLVQELRPLQTQYDYYNRCLNKIAGKMADPPVFYTRHNVPNTEKPSEWLKDMLNPNTSKEYVPDPTTGQPPIVFDKQIFPNELFEMMNQAERDMRQKAALKPILQGDKGSMGRLESFGDVNKILETAMIPLMMRGELKDTSMKILLENTLELMISTSWANDDRVVRLMDLDHKVNEVVVNPSKTESKAGFKYITLRNLYFDIAIQNQGTKATVKQEKFALLLHLYSLFPEQWRDLEFLMQYSSFENTDQYLRKIDATNSIRAENALLKKQLSMAFKVISYITNREVLSKMAAKVAGGSNQILNALRGISLQFSKMAANPEERNSEGIAETQNLLKAAEEDMGDLASLFNAIGETVVMPTELQAMIGNPSAADSIPKSGTGNMPKMGTNLGQTGAM